MKKVLFTILMAISLNGFCQYSSFFDFETPYHHLWGPTDTAWIDTTTFQNNVWEIGIPQKTLFNSAYSLTNAIVTKLSSFYPNNDTSIFVIKQIVGHPVSWPFLLGISGYYKIDTDDSTDFGIIEFSPDNGHSWVNLMSDSVNWDGQKPVLSGNSIGWNSFSNILYEYTLNVGVGDTIWYKFTFISDSVQTNKEGWMIDNIGLNFIGEGIGENKDQNNVFTSPNPFTTSTQITLDKTYHNISLSVYDIQGKLMLQNQYADCNTIQLGRNGLGNGMYFLKLGLDDKWVETTKIVVSE
jgi:hypothetical protein